jgi:uncharacterized membrane protein YbhN (UPF0104 family)
MDFLDVNSMASSAASQGRDLHGIGGSRYRDFDHRSAHVEGVRAPSSHGATNPVIRERFQAAIDLAGGKENSRKSSRRWAKLASDDASPMLKKIIKIPCVQALIIWVFAALLLYFLAPPIVCKSNEDDDLDAYNCNPCRVIIWAAIAPLVVMIYPHIPSIYGTVASGQAVAVTGNSPP